MYDMFVYFLIKLIFIHLFFKLLNDLKRKPYKCFLRQN